MTGRDMVKVAAKKRGSDRIIDAGRRQDRFKNHG